jgi:hypothetical protein
VQVGEAGRFASHLDARFFAWSGPASMCLYLVLSFRKPALALPNMLIGDEPELCAMSLVVLRMLFVGGGDALSRNYAANGSVLGEGASNESACFCKTTLPGLQGDPPAWHCDGHL